jgi:hypothetical protein
MSFSLVRNAQPQLMVRLIFIGAITLGAGRATTLLSYTTSGALNLNACVSGEISSCNNVQFQSPTTDAVVIDQTRGVANEGSDTVGALTNASIVVTTGQMKFSATAEIFTDEYRTNLLNGDSMGASAQGIGDFSDHLLVNGPAGGFTTLRYANELDYSTSGCSPLPGPVTVECQIASTFQVGSTSIGDGQIAQIIVANGSTVDISGELDAAVLLSGLAGPNDPVNFPDFVDYSTSLFALHTNNFYVDDLTPGSSLTSVSGHDYSTPTTTPEPATAVLLGLPVLFLAGAKVSKSVRKVLNF